MTEEKKSDLNEQQSFLSGHEELLETLNQKKTEAENQPERIESTEETPAVEPAEEISETQEPVTETEPVEDVSDAAEEAAPEIEQEKPAPVLEPEIIAEEPEPIVTQEPVIEEPEPVVTAKPVVEEPTVKPPKPAKKTGLKPSKKKKSQHSPQHEELLKKQALEQQEVKEVLVWIRKYAKPSAIALAVICIVVLADKALKTQRYKKEAAADSALMNAQNPDDLQAIIDDYASTPSKPIALMGLAREKFNAGQIDEAEALYTQFIKKHGGHELALQADLNLIACKEANGQLGDAHLLYGEFATENSDSYLAPSALMGKARCLEALGLFDEAQIAYEDILVNFPEGIWAQIAEANLKVMLAKK